jgi:beta-lactamase regulating signal transducer with metallopeptidase domain
LHACILALTAAAFLLPHLRLITWSELDPAPHRPAMLSALSLAGRICGWIWLSGALAMLVLCTGGIVRAIFHIRAAVADDGLKKRLHDFAPSSAANESIEIRVSPNCLSPFCWQLHRPVICLPEIVLEFPLAEQAAIIRHELAHLQLQHPLHLFLQRMVEAAFWFHPLVWWSSRQAAAAREFRCDRAAVSSRCEVAEYLRSLLWLIESQIGAASRLSAGLGFLGDSALLRRRANLLIAYLESPLPCRRLRIAFVLIAACLSLTLWMPVNPRASCRAAFAPWPKWSARAMDAVGIPLRDYEVDGHRLDAHSHAPTPET